jgi:type IV pilus assembly protein PilB
MSQQLAKILRGSGALTGQELENSLRQASARNVSLWDVLTLERHVPEDALADALSSWLKLPRVRIDSVDVEPAAVRAVAGSVARRHTCLPIRLKGHKNLVLAMTNPLDDRAIQDVQFASSRTVEPVVASRTEILIGIEKHYSSARTVDTQPPAAAASVFVTSERDELNLDQIDPLLSDTTPSVHLCNLILRDAVTLRASDIHIEPGPHELRVRLRVDGVLRDLLQMPRWMHSALVSRLKIVAKLDIAKQRLPQDGRIKVRSHDEVIDVRVSTLPTHFGEKVVMRLLRSASIPTPAELGLSVSEMSLLEEALSQPQGFILVTGPTGAGKSTTLYSMLARRQSSEVNIVTIEDPIEYRLAGTTQVQVDVGAGLTFASCLRSIVRQDPDVILVGEIRDLETAEIAFQAALTGHLVFSTLHANGSLSAIERLLDLGVRPLAITSATNLIIAQRLARRICMNCRVPDTPSVDTLRKLHLETDGHVFARGKGCERCRQTGYSGRVGIFEILALTRELKELVSRRASESEMRDAASRAGTRFLLDDAVQKAREGLTTLEEILRVIRIEHARERGTPNRFEEGRSVRALPSNVPVRRVDGKRRRPQL